ncbi:hypothetical protein PAXINDRAFT_96187 [Paxillus involutus ATCC 200175]|nr:hypothetical protein PAXINDRAFT_96187 [Paxillus involutus ATCC 200175]
MIRIFGPGLAGAPIWHGCPPCGHILRVTHRTRTHPHPHPHPHPRRHPQNTHRASYQSAVHSQNLTPVIHIDASQPDLGLLMMSPTLSRGQHLQLTQLRSRDFRKKFHELYLSGVAQRSPFHESLRWWPARLQTFFLTGMKYLRYWGARGYIQVMPKDGDSYNLAESTSDLISPLIASAITWHYLRHYSRGHWK